MRIENARLIDGGDYHVSFKASPNHGGTMTPVLLVIHYTASLTTEETVSWFMNAAAKVSAHLVIGRDGSIVQMVPFDTTAWHAGVSHWGTLDSLNAHSVGVELVNAGKLLGTADRWVDWRGRKVPGAEVVELTHKNETKPAGWQLYTEAQMSSLLESGMALQQQYSFLDIVGHDDIAPGRKTDPGPAFALQSFRARILGRA
jgi:N-acetylmuramoyl-L-alanine amidase